MKLLKNSKILIGFGGIVFLALAVISLKFMPPKVQPNNPNPAGVSSALLEEKRFAAINEAKKEGKTTYSFSVPAMPILGGM